MGMTGFPHKRLEVYRAAVGFTIEVDKLANDIPPSHRHLRDQLRRAAASICLNIAEGSSEFSRPDKARFYRFARRSASECDAVLDLTISLGLVAHDRVPVLAVRLDRIAGMLTRMIIAQDRPDAGAEAGGGGNRS
jgi:four helix bundle protein